MGDKLLLKLNIYGKPIANKYYEGKVKRTLKRGLKDLKSLSRKWLEGSHLLPIMCRAGFTGRPGGRRYSKRLSSGPVTDGWHSFGAQKAERTLTARE